MSQYGALDTVLHQLQEFKRKYYLNLLIRGIIFSLGLLLSFFLIYNLLEYFFYFNYYVRAFLFFSFLAITVYVFVRWILAPLSALANLRRLLSDEQAATQVGQYYPEISDKLLNTIQLKGLSKTNELIAASIEQKSGQLSMFRFTESIKLNENRPFLKYVLVPLSLVLFITLLYPSIFVQGTERIVNYKRFYAPAAPFQFIIRNDELKAFRNEDFQLQVEVQGETVPSEVSIRYNGREQKLTRTKGNVYAFDFKKLQKPVHFQLEGSGFMSDEYTLALLSRPNLKDFHVQVNYPAYLNKKPEIIRNTGNFSVPAGSVVDWNFVAGETESVELRFQTPDQVLEAQAENDQFKASKKIMQSQPYAVQLRNQYSTNKEEINYQVNAIPDRFPEISVESFSDTLNFAYLILGGNILDDYGLTRLNLHYRVVPAASGTKETPYKALPVRFDSRQLSQTYYHQWNVEPLQLQPGDRLEYFVQVWDNDGVTGHKSARTRTLDFKVPNRQDLQSELASNASSVENQLSKSLEKTQQLKSEILKSEDKLKTKKALNWQDRKALEELVQKKQQLENDLESLKKLNEQLNQKQDRFDQKSQELAEKAQQLQKLMDDLLDEETKKLYEELEKLLRQKNNEQELQNLLSKLDNKEKTLEKQLERLLDMFKQLQIDQKLEQTTEKLSELAKEQEDLSEKTTDKKQDTDQLQQEQAEIQKEFEEVKEELKELEDLNEEMESPSPMEDTSSDEKQVEEEMQKSQEQLSKQQQKKASQSQKNAAQKMQEMAQKMEQMQESMEMESQQENIDDLRAILENLIKLSFDQEELMKSFRSVNQSDPRFIALSQQQLKIRDDARMVEDSLNALAKRVFQIQSFVTREVGEMNQNMDLSSQRIKDRNVGRATGHQQMAMTSMNNLALMLNDALKQMQEAQMQMMQMQAGGGKSKKKGEGKPQPGDLGKMQDALNQKIQELQKSGKSGQGLSEELAKLAAQQEMLRQAMKELEKMGQQPGEKPGEGKLGNISKMMEQTETDLVNKRLTEQTVLRQREILTRLLEAEKAVKERELDDKREAQTATNKDRAMPPSFEKYLKTKEKQTELLKTISPSLSPYYKQEVNKYFQKIGT